jgi:glutathione synthase/RimK-type ligase-like ATP-grasp enzyme
MKIAVHHREGSFSDRWIAYFKDKGIPYKIVNCYHSDIIENLADCDALMWHHHHGRYIDKLVADRILFSLEQAGIPVFPNFNTNWHFDDKVGQKYLLEAVGAPLVPSYVFYSKREASQWIEKATFPKVFKLRGGAGSSNVCLVNTKKQAKEFINIAFGKGFKQFDGYGYLKDTYRKYTSGIVPFYSVVRAFGRMVFSTNYSKKAGREKGYIYFQDFIPNNDSDYRIIIINKKAFALKRMVRRGDFRASGSGEFYYDVDLFNKNLLKLSFNIAEKLKMQSCAFDFVYDQNKDPLIVEISYGFSPAGYEACPGYWDNELQFHKGKINPYGWMVDEIIANNEKANK